LDQQTFGRPTARHGAARVVESQQYLEHRTLHCDCPDVLSDRYVAEPFGTVSRQHLASLVFGQDVTVEWHKRDRYGRLVGRVVVDGRDANLAQSEAGLAWHYVAYAGEQAPADRQAYSQAEQAARARAAGIWRDHEPVAIIAFISEAVDVRAILEHIGEPTTPPRIASARGPPEWYEDSAEDAIDAEEYPAGDPLAQPEPEYEYDQRMSW
jgi:hypothetical protein